MQMSVTAVHSAVFYLKHESSDFCKVTDKHLLLIELPSFELFHQTRKQLWKTDSSRPCSTLNCKRLGLLGEKKGDEKFWLPLPQKNSEFDQNHDFDVSLKSHFSKSFEKKMCNSEMEKHLQGFLSVYPNRIHKNNPENYIV